MPAGHQVWHPESAPKATPFRPGTPPPHEHLLALKRHDDVRAAASRLPRRRTPNLKFRLRQFFLRRIRHLGVHGHGGQARFIPGHEWKSFVIPIAVEYGGRNPSRPNTAPFSDRQPPAVSSGLSARFQLPVNVREDRKERDLERVVARAAAAADVELIVSGTCLSVRASPSIGT